MKSFDVSVIVPAYNAENCLDKCIVSLLRQTLQSIEIIVVNDGSSDKTAEIINGYANRFPEKFVAIHQENKGASAARNNGILNARGTYIGFVDADDWIDSDMMRQMYKDAEENESDLVFCGRYDVVMTGDRPRYIKRSPNNLPYGTDIFQAPVLLSDTTQFIWDKLFRRSILMEHQILFSESFRFTEDVLFLCVYKYYCKKITAIMNPLYYYCIADRNVTVKYGDKILDVPHVMEAIFAFFTEQGCYDQFTDVFFDIIARRYLLRVNKYAYMDEKKLQYQFCSEMFDVFAKYFPHWRKKLRVYRTNTLGERIGNTYRSNRLFMKLYIFMPNGIQLRYKQLRLKSKRISKKGKNKWDGKIKVLKAYKHRIDEIYLSSRYYHHLRSTPIAKNKVMIESKGGKDLAGNMFRILEQMLLMKMSIVLVVQDDSKDKIRTMLSTYKMNSLGIKFVKHGSHSYYKALATSKYLFNDSAFPARFTKRDDQIYTNTWHGTPLKFMGRDVPGRSYAIGGVQRNLLLADYLVYPNEYMKEKMTESYMLTHLYQGEYLLEGYPRNSVFFDTKRRESLKAELGLSDKRIYVYMPTWRGLMTNKQNSQQWDDTAKYFDKIDRLLEDDQILYVKMHLYASNGFSLHEYKHIKPFPTEYETYDFLNLADSLITDYSSVFYDFANTGRKIVLFVYDEDDYFDERGVYMQLDELPFPKVKTAKDLVAELNSPKNYDDTEFLKRCCTYDNIDAAERICDFLVNGDELARKQRISIGKDTTDNKKPLASISALPESNQKENVLLYVYTLRNNLRTKVLMDTLESLDTTKRNYYICVLGTSMRKVSDRLDKLPRSTYLLSLAGANYYTIREAAAYYFAVKKDKTWKWTGKYLDRLYGREWLRCFDHSRFDSVLVYDDYDKKRISMMEQFDGEKCLFLERKALYSALGRSKETNRFLLRSCRRYKNIAYVSQLTNKLELPAAKAEGISIVTYNLKDEAPAQQFESLLKGLAK